jgi:HlyD family secretion protein
MPRVSRERVIAAAVALGLVAALAYAFLPGPVPAELGAVVRGPLVVTVDQDGKTRVRDRYVVSAPLQGQLLRIALRAGDPIEAGRTQLAVIEPKEPDLLDPREEAQAQAKVKAAEAVLQRTAPLLMAAEAEANLARKELDRLTRLREARVASQQEFDAAAQREQVAAQNLRAAQFASRIAEFELEMARAVLVRSKPRSPGETPPRLEIIAPVSGRVLRVFQESATVVQAGARLLEVGNPIDLEAEIDVLSADAVKVRPGARVILEHWGGSEPLAGRVRVVEPSAFTKVSALGVEEQRVNVIVDLVDPPEKRPTLGDAYRVEARIVVWEATDVLKVPAGALFRRGDGWAAFVVAGGRAEERAVEIGHRNDAEAEVLAGLGEGERVVLYPGDRVRPGVRVAAR